MESTVPPKSWTWEEEDRSCGVHTFEAQLVWWVNPSGPNGHLGQTAREQSFEDYRNHGPAVSAPEWVIKELDVLLPRK